MQSFSAKTKGETRSTSGEKTHFFVRQKYLADGVARGPKFGRVKNFCLLDTFRKDFLFKSKTKNL